MKLLIVGAGAVGQVFGLSAQRGGATVSVYVKPKYADGARAGFDLYDHGARDAHRRFVPDGVLTSPEEVAAARPDAILLCMSSTALRAGSWIRDLAEAAPDATIVGMQPGLGDADYVREAAGAHRVVWGIIELISYQSPLPGKQGPEGVAYWIPPRMPFPFSGPSERVGPVVALFRAARLNAREVADTTELTTVGSPVLLLHMAALEAAGWSFRALRKDPELLPLTRRAMQQAVAAAAHAHGVKVPLWIRLLRPWHVRIASHLAVWWMPLDIETYLRFHFTKVGDQTRDGFRRWFAAADEAGLPTDALRALQDRLVTRAEAPRATWVDDPSRPGTAPGRPA